jgi:excinuclease ABC subunit A
MKFGGDKHVLSEHRAQPRCVVEGGGEIVAEGTPEQVAATIRSYTGGYLKDLLAKSVRAELAGPRPRKKRASPASAREREAAE